MLTRFKLDALGHLLRRNGRLGRVKHHISAICEERRRLVTRLTSLRDEKTKRMIERLFAEMTRATGGIEDPGLQIVGIDFQVVVIPARRAQLRDLHPIPVFLEASLESVWHRHRRYYHRRGRRKW